MIESSLFRWLCRLLIAACVVVRAVDGLFSHWNAIRFSRALALVLGYDLYTPPDSGVISGVIYGPVGYFLYAPAALWKSPLPAIATACLVSALVTLGPAAWMLSERRNTGGAKPWILPVFTVLVLHFYASGATVGVWMVHTDAGALGLTCLALIFTLRHPVERGFSWNIAAAALCAALAVWAKQTSAPILVLPCAYLLWRGCRAGAVWVLTLTIGSAALLGAVFAGFYGFDDLLLSVFQVPSRHQRYPGAPLREWRLITDFMEMLYLFGAALAASVACVRPTSAATDLSRSASLLERWTRRAGALVPDWTAWPLVFATGLAMLPMSLLGRMKSGGTANNFGITDYFLSLGIALLILRLAARDEFRQGAARRGLEASLLLLLAVMGARTAANLLLTCHGIAGQWPPPIQVAYDYARKHPGTTYFPWHPLATLMAEGRYVHTAWGVMERESAGFPVSDAHFRDSLPVNLRRIATSDDTSLFSVMQSRQWDDYLLRRLPELRCPVNLPELPGWAVLEQGAENCRSSGGP